MSGACPDIAPAPPVIVTYAPDASTRGPMISPRSMASRTATSISARKVPRSLTVVKPVSKIFRAFGIDSNARCAAVWRNSDVGSGSSLLPTICVCASMKPGITVMPERSITTAPTGASPPATIACMTPLRMTIERSSSTTPLRTSINLPALMTTSASRSCAVAAGVAKLVAASTVKIKWRIALPRFSFPIAVSLIVTDAGGLIHLF